MKKACIVTAKTYQKNKLFDLNDKKLNRDNCLYIFSCLKNQFYIKGYNLSTDDINKPEESDIIIYNDIHSSLPQKGEISHSYLLLFEPEIIIPKNWDKKVHKYFKKIFTWNDDYIDNVKYFKFNYSYLFPSQIDFVEYNKKKLCVMVAGNRSSKHKNELYSERLKAIEWFERNHPAEFDLYGFNWSKYIFSGNKFIERLNNMEILQKVFAKNRASYKGIIENKKEIFRNYKFAICYENISNVNGYITEKIFDCFFSGCIPIYWGAKNITDYIPKNCFINKEDFNNYDSLYNFIHNISRSDYENILNNIMSFLNGNSANNFRAENVTFSVVKNILD